MFTEVQRLSIAKVFPYFQVGTCVGLEGFWEFAGKFLLKDKVEVCLAYDISLMDMLLQTAKERDHDHAHAKDNTGGCGGAVNTDTGYIIRV